MRNIIIKSSTLNSEFTPSKILKEDHLAILKSLVYSDVFDYPLTYEELYQFIMGKKISKSDFDKILYSDLIPTFIRSNKNFFTLPMREEIIDKRISKQNISKTKWFQAFSLSYLLSHFPFVRMIAITGSLVFDNIKDKYDDIDFFIIIERNHLWTTRLFIYTLVRIFELFNTKICPNYIISDRYLELDDKNFYSARELKQMIPIYGENLFEKFKNSNKWADNYYPNAVNKNQLKFTFIKHKQSKIKSLLEKLLSNKIFSFLEIFEMNRQINRLKKISTSNSENNFTKDCAKCHIDGHGNWIKQKYHMTFENLLINEEQLL